MPGGADDGQGGQRGEILLAVLCAALAVSVLRAYNLGHVPRGRRRLCDPPRDRSRSSDGKQARPHDSASLETLSGAGERSAFRREKSSGTSAQLKGNVLLLIAHPDDEAMFFVPSILAATQVRSYGVMFWRLIALPSCATSTCHTVHASDR